ncbi:DUF928 domain-containing protein [Anabaena sp. FACHB-1237]|uniref:DUF928 domain-containing protein n=1 Tax=Anabaena sp. FACHB-1237 TaxID=2692769 RepID=UPI0016815E75|nr:DUF928 domain-containing protein [Anabaena sp. FACHB-1237]MBD2137820.1 DUF928 domain-containing protein [Anabaena sp. FACHB-1237]
MKLQKYIQPLGKLPLVLVPSLVILSAFPAQLLAQSSPMQISLKFPQAEDRGAPDKTIGGGRRGTSCIKLDPGKPSLTALMPNRKNTGNTAKDGTSLFVYVPKSTAKTAEFLVMDEEGEEIYKQELKMTGTSGIMKASVPEKVPLKVGKSYTWYFTIVCNPEDSNSNESVKGMINRVALKPSEQKLLQNKDLYKQAEIYAQNNYWYNTLEAMMEIRKEKPNEWRELLSSVGLKELADAPNLSETTPNKPNLSQTTPNKPNLSKPKP